MASSVHRWDDMRVYYKEANALSKEHELRLVAVGDPNTVDTPDQDIEVVRLAGGNGLRGRLRRILEIIKRVLNDEYDVFHFHDPELLPVGWIAKIRGRKVLYDMHENALIMLLRRRWIPWPLALPVGLSTRVVELLSLFVFDGFILAERWYQRVFKTAKCRTVLNYPMTGTTYEPGVREAGSHLDLVYVGSLTTARGITDLIEAVSDLQAEGSSLKLHLYGKIDEEEVERKLSEHSAASWLHFHGWLAGEHVLQELSQYHVGVSPLRNKPGYRHSLPTKILEYAVAGLAIIASDLPASKNIVDELGCGITYKANDIVDLKKAIRALNDERERQLVVNSRHSSMQSYSWASQELELLKLYRELQ
ncbi:MAG: glycosyltransferase [Candidatus Marinimicrobia bacterium]|nr:glycosyltransferase [Candidatus Neomarinimicrobiota bacterium]